MKTLNKSLSIIIPEKFYSTQRCLRFRAALLAAAGGYTSAGADGAYLGASGELIEEEVVTLTCAFNADGYCDIDLEFALFTVWLLNQGEQVVFISGTDDDGNTIPGILVDHDDKAGFIQLAAEYQNSKLVPEGSSVH